MQPNKAPSMDTPEPANGNRPKRTCKNIRNFSSWKVNCFAVSTR